VVEPDSNQPVVFYVNPTGAPGFCNCRRIAGGNECMVDGRQFAPRALRRRDRRLRVQAADGANTISFNNCDNYFARRKAVRSLGRFRDCQVHAESDEDDWRTQYAKAVESNMSFNPYGLCNFTNRCQIQEVVTHEMGHALGLGHSSDTNATMSAYAHFDNRCASVMPDDAQGIKAIYPGGAGVGQLRIMTADLPAASMDRDYTANLEASGGTGGYNWHVISGQMPAGLQLGMSGMLFGKTNAQETIHL
jgi:hypothetical protein